LDHVEHGSLQQLVIELGDVAQVVESSRTWQRSTASCRFWRRRRAMVSGDVGELRVSGDTDELLFPVTPMSYGFRRCRRAAGIRRHRRAAVSGDADDNDKLPFPAMPTSYGFRRRRRAAVSGDADEMPFPATPGSYGVWRAAVFGDPGELRFVSAVSI
jgi:hypothetical protein